MMRIGLTGILLDDQDRAERCYTGVLGFQGKTRAAYGPNERWLTVVSPEDPDGVELVLHPADEPAVVFSGPITSALYGQGPPRRCSPWSTSPLGLVGPGWLA
jgi:Glyoxalase/Bleomycin resistance protein/Dioxygenase superfamily